MVWATFFERVRPVSTSAKPACMNITKKAQTHVQTRFAETVKSPRPLAVSADCLAHSWSVGSNMCSTRHTLVAARACDADVTFTRSAFRSWFARVSRENSFELLEKA